MTNDLVGKWIYLSEENYWKSGLVKSYLGDQVYVVKVDKMKDSTVPIEDVYEVVSILRYLFPQDHGIPWIGISVFDTEKDLRDFIKWSEEPENGGETPTPKDNIVRIKPKKD